MRGGWLMGAVLAILVARPAGGDEALNLNTATKEQLVALGLSASQALQVIGHREKNGPFLQVEELMAVPQMNKQSFEKIHTRVTVDE